MKMEMQGFDELDISLKKILRDLKQPQYVKVGILGRKDNRQGGDSNATIGFKHEVGSNTERIPQRSFLRMPLQHKSKVIIKLLLKNKEKIEKSIKDGNGSSDIVKNIGLICEKVIQKAFATGGFGKWKPNSAYTIKMKGSSSPLIDTAQLRKSITSKVEKYGA